MKRFRKLWAWMLSFALMLGCFANAGAVKAAEGEQTGETKFTVNIIAGNTMTLTGKATQEVVSGGAMEKVQCVAESGFFFPDDYADKISNAVSGTAAGIGYKVENNQIVTISGTPQGDIDIRLPDANEKAKQDKPLNISGGICVIKGTTAQMEYANKTDSDKWEACEEGSTEVSAGTWYVRYKDTTTALASETVEVEVVATYSVSIKLPEEAHMKKTSGEAEQKDLKGEMEAVVYEANDDYYFPSSYGAEIEPKNAEIGVTVSDDLHSITISGKATKNVTITLNDATEKALQTAPDIKTETNVEEGLVRVTTDMEYAEQPNATTWTPCIEENIKKVTAGEWYVRYKETDKEKASEATKVVVKAVYQITFVKNQGDSNKEEKVVAGEKVKEPTEKMEKTGCSFAGWYTDQNYTNKYDFETVVTGTITLYAKWECTIVFQNDKGISPDSITFTEGAGVSKDEMDKRTPAAKEGEIFLGWYDDEQNLYTEIPKDKKSMTLHAVWGKVYIKGKSEVFVPIDTEGANPLQAVAEDVDTGKYKITYTWKRAGDIKGSDAFCTPSLSKLGSEQYYCEITVESGNFKSIGVTSKVKVTGYQSKIKVTLHKKVTVKSILGDASKNYKITMKSKDNKSLKVDNKKGTLKANKYNKKKKFVIPVTVTIDGQKVTVQVTIKLPKPKIKVKKGKRKRYIEGVYRNFKVSYKNIKGATRVVAYISKKKKLKTFKKAPTSINKKKGAKINMKKGSYRYLLIYAYYGKGKSPVSNIVKLKG